MRETQSVVIFQEVANPIIAKKRWQLVWWNARMPFHHVLKSFELWENEFSQKGITKVWFRHLSQQKTRTCRLEGL
jgi:hypothetical protein